jgi:hypothetical protein
VQRFVLLALLSVLAFAVLAYLGEYPASTARHVSWVTAFALAGLMFAADLAAGPATDTGPGKGIEKGMGKGAGAGPEPVAAARPRAGLRLQLALIALLALPAAQTARMLTDPARPYVMAENARVADWLAAQTPHRVAIWEGEQVLDYYHQRNPALERHVYVVYEANLPEAPKTRPIRIGWGQTVGYSVSDGFAQGADRLITDMPAGEAFLIYASHARYASEHADTVRKPYLDLIAALDRQNCSHDFAVAERMVYVLKAVCGEAMSS